MIGTFRDATDFRDDIAWQTDLIAKFKTGSVEHQLLAGVELFNAVRGVKGVDSVDTTINIFNPDFSNAIRNEDVEEIDFKQTLNTFGLYLQAQITLLPNLKFLAGGRYDFSDFKSEDNEFGNDSF